MNKREYAFGDDEVAARRLADLAALYEPTTRAFLAAHASTRPALALDLGCGPGHTTALLAEVLQPERIVGVDESEAFLDEARRRLPDAEFVAHDVRVLSFPVPPADVVYARFLLAHLPDPADVAVAWTRLLAPDGVLLLEEGEAMSSSNAACARYLDLVRATLRAEGRELFPGAALAGIGDGQTHRVRHCDTVTIRRPARQFAGLFAPNLRQWGPRALELGVANETDLGRLRTSLEGMATGDAGGIVTAVLRQVALTRP